MSTSSDLERFRQQWQQEVQARAKTTGEPVTVAGTSKQSQQPRTKPERPLNKPPTKHPLADVGEPEDQRDADGSGNVIAEKLQDLTVVDVDDDGFAPTSQHEPRDALEHFERAVEKEGQGNLGESLAHYRRAYRLDAKVDQAYKDKHFAQQWKSKPKALATAPASSTTAPSTSNSQPASQVPLTISELIASFAQAQISGEPPVIEGDLPPPCPIKDLPTEVMLELLKHIALIDISVFTRLACVCKRLAYHVFTESAIWKRVSLGPELGLASQQYYFETDVHGRPVIWQTVGEADEDAESDEKPMPLVKETAFPPDQDWREFLHSYPRIRYSGVYISTVNYTRSGGAAATWGAQVHIVTYFRYLRFFRDGTVISLLTTHSPTEVVHLLTKENVAIVRSSNSREPMHPLNFTSSAPALMHHDRGKGKADVNMPPPSAQNIMKHALRGRWRLCHPSLSSIEIGSNSGTSGDIHIETEGGAGPRYMYTMHLSLKSGNTRNKNATRNNKLVWKGFWSFNHMTNDWAEFQLRNDKAFWFSRVKSYGLGY